MVIAAASCLINLVPILVASGSPPMVAAGVAGVAGLSNILGRLTTGYLIDRMNANIVAGVSVAVPGGGFLLLLLAPGSAPAAFGAAFILGLSIGAELDTVAYLTTRHFGLRNFGLLFAIVGGALTLSAAGGPLLANFVYDMKHSYIPILWAYIPISMLGSILFFTLGAYPKLPAQEEEAALEKAIEPLPALVNP
jgi:MFS family permease